LAAEIPRILPESRPVLKEKDYTNSPVVVSIL